jgi:hypothetical protein
VVPTCRCQREREGGGEGRPAVVLGQLGRKACWAALGGLASAAGGLRGAGLGASGLLLLLLGYCWVGLEGWAESEEGKR